MASDPTADRLKHDIDEGRTGDKVNFPDPAAAPLGTDAEAGGTPPTAAELRMDLAAQGPPRRWDPDATGVGIYLFVGIPVGLMLLLLVSIAAQAAP